jgi:3-hydroxypropanoate dehydrogenase
MRREHDPGRDTETDAGADVRSRLVTRPPEMLLKMAQQSGTMQGGYLILAARALGLDCVPIGGVDTDKVDDVFMAGTAWTSNFLLNLGYADHAQLVPRRPRLDFEDACRRV